jgi:phosphonate transport system substrate-binding protein
MPSPSTAWSALGARPGFFGRVVEAGFHQRAIRLVHAGAVDAAAIDSQVLAVELAGLRVVGAFGPSTIQPVVAASHLPDRLKDEVRAMLAVIEVAGWTSLTQPATGR